MKDLEISKDKKLSLWNDRYWHLPLLGSSCSAGPLGEQALSTPDFCAFGEVLRNLLQSSSWVCLTVVYFHDQKP